MTTTPPAAPASETAPGPEAPPAPETTEALPMDRLLQLLDLDEAPAERERTTAWTGQPQPVPADRVFGGLQLAQAVVAAGRTTPSGQILASLQADFIAGVPTGGPLRWVVDHLAEAPALSTRRSTLLDPEGRELFTALTRWAAPREDLPSHQPHHRDPAADAAADPAARPEADPEALPDLRARYGHDERIPAWWRINRPVNIHHATPPPYLDRAEPVGPAGEQTTWWRASGPVPADPVIRAAVVAYATDMSILEPAFRATGAARHAPGSRILSLTHTLTLHRLPDPGPWLRFDTTLEALSHGRAQGHGRLHDLAGHHLASATQVGLVKFGA